MLLTIFTNNAANYNERLILRKHIVSKITFKKVLKM